MSFVLKKSRPISVPIQAGDEEFVLKVKKIKQQKLLLFYSEHAEAIREFSKLAKAEESKVKDKSPPTLNADQIRLMAGAAEIVAEAATGWEGVVDEAGKPIKFSKAALLELIEQDISLYTGMLNAINAMAPSGKSEKN